MFLCLFRTSKKKNVHILRCVVCVYLLLLTLNVFSLFSVFIFSADFFSLIQLNVVQPETFAFAVAHSAGVTLSVRMFIQLIAEKRHYYLLGSHQTKEKLVALFFFFRFCHHWFATLNIVSLFVVFVLLLCSPRLKTQRQHLSFIIRNVMLAFISTAVDAKDKSVSEKNININ